MPVKEKTGAEKKPAAPVLFHQHMYYFQYTVFLFLRLGMGRAHEKIEIIQCHICNAKKIKKFINFLKMAILKIEG